MLIRAIVGGLIGGVLGGGVAAVLDSSLDGGAAWAVLLAGLGAGLGTRLACGANRNFMTGIVAAIFTIVAIVGISLFKAQAEIQSASKNLAEGPLRVIPPQPITEQELAEAAAKTDQETDEPAESDNPSPEETGREETPEPDAAPEAEGLTSDEGGSVAPSSQDARPVKVSPRQSATSRKPPRPDDGSTMEAILNGVSAVLAFFLATGTVSGLGSTDQQEASSDPVDSDA